MSKLLKSFVTVVVALWVGILFCLGFIVAPYLFALAAQKSAAVPNTGVAADLIGPLLSSADLIGLAAGGLLIVALLYLRRQGEIPLGGRWYLSEIGMLLAVTCAATNYWFVAPRIKGVKHLLAERYGAYHLADKSDLLYREFGHWHQTSTVLFLIVFGAALACLVCLTQFPPLSADRRVR